MISQLSKILGIFIPLIFILNKSSSEFVGIWLFFITILSLQFVVDSGFSQNFIRIFAFSMSGIDESDIKKKIVDYKAKSLKPNINLLGKLFKTSQVTYFFLGLAWSFLLLCLAYIPLEKLVEESAFSNEEILKAFYLLIIACFIRMYGFCYSTYLHGVDLVAICKKNESISWLFFGTISLLIIFYKVDILLLVLGLNLMILINIILNYISCKNHQSEQGLKKEWKKFDIKILVKVLPNIIRSSFGAFFGAGLIQFTSLIFSGLFPLKASSLLLATNIIRTGIQLCQIPLYSRLPLIAQMRILSSQKELTIFVNGLMRISLNFIAMFFILFGIFGSTIINFISLETVFVSGLMWSLFALSSFLEKYASMHLQIYSTTNKIIFHKAVGLHAIIFMSFLYLFLPYFEEYSIPLSQLLSCVLFYTWFSVTRSYSALEGSFITNEMKIFTLPCIYLVVYILYNMFNI